MLIYETFYLILSCLLLYPIGKVFFRDLDFIVQVFFGILIASILLSITARFVPLYSREILGFISFVCLLVLFIDFNNHSTKSLSFINNYFYNRSRIFIKFLIIFILFVLLLRDFSLLRFAFESHDVHIFGPTIEVFNANYLGNIKNPIVYPLELSAYHILPGIFLGVANFLNPSIDLVALINAKFILVSFFFSYGFYKVFNYFNFSLFAIALGFALLFFFKETIGYNISISSYLYQIALIFLAIIFFDLDISPNNKSLQAAFMSILIMLACVKIPIFYVVLPPLLYLFFNNPRQFFEPRLFSISVLCFFNLLSILLIPRSPEIEEITKYSLMNIFNYDSVRTIAGLWFVENRFLELFNFLHIYIADINIYNRSLVDYLNLLIKVIYIFIFYFGLAFFVFKFFNNSPIKKALKIYIITAILGWLFVRNNGNLDQQNHLFFNISLLSAMLFFRVVPLKKEAFSFYGRNILLCIIFIFVLSDMQNIFNPKLSGDSISYRNSDSIQYSEFKNLSPLIADDRLIIDPSVPFWESALISQMSGKRIYYEDLNNYDINYKDYHLAQYTLD